MPSFTYERRLRLDAAEQWGRYAREGRVPALFALGAVVELLEAARRYETEER